MPALPALLPRNIKPRALWRALYTSAAFPWIAACFLLSLAVTEYGGTNALSRYATMRAATESGTFSIDRYKDWTLDWSQSPDGRIYSNKAPGAALIGLPLFAFTDSLAALAQGNSRDAFGRRPAPTYWQVTLQWILTQALPFFLACAALTTWLARVGVPPGGLIWFALAALFGNTAVIFLNSYFGHAFASWLWLAALLSWIYRRYGWSALCLGGAVLTDYIALPLIPLWFIFTAWRERSIRWLPRAGAGLALPAILWTAYHWICFGSPWVLASQFINPEQVETAAEAGALWGFLRLMPPLEILQRLLFGPERGLLYTQPWVLVIAVLFPFVVARQHQRGKKIFLWLYGWLLLATAAALWITASFTGWHGGWSAGPRYFSCLLPAWALLGAVLLPRVAPVFRFLLWGTLLSSLLLRSLIYTGGVLAPLEPLWNYYARALWLEPRPTAWLRFGLFWAVLLAAYAWAKRRNMIAWAREHSPGQIG